MESVVPFQQSGLLCDRHHTGIETFGCIVSIGYCLFHPRPCCQSSELRISIVCHADRSVIRLYAEISLFSHSTTISLFPCVTRPRERSRAFPSFSERFRAFRSSLRFPSQYSRAQLIEARLTLHCITQV